VTGCAGGRDAVTTQLPTSAQTGGSGPTTTSQAIAGATAVAGMRDSLRKHWPEYAIEAGGLGIFMVAACLFAALLEHPASPLHHVVPDALLRRLLMGLAMGGTAVALIYSPWGQRSGAHLNPSVTLGFWRLGKVAPWDAAFYVVAQFVGGIGGVVLVAAVVRGALAHPAVSYVVTVPGRAGTSVAFVAELAISFGLFAAVLATSSSARLARFTGLVAGALVAGYIAIEAPYSGMSMNPARTLGSAVSAGVWSGLWVYFTAPTLGMLLASELHRRTKGLGGLPCAKLQHTPHQPCIFACGYRLISKGDVVLRQDEPADVAYVIDRGEVEVRRRDERGHEVVLARLGPRECVGEMALLLGQPRSATVVAVTDVQLRPFTRASFADVVANDSTAALHMLRQLAQRLSDTDRRITR
jgi:aquaporin Z